MSKTNSKKWIFCTSFILAFITHCSMFFGGAMSANEDNFTIYFRSMNASYGRWICDILYELGISSCYLVQSWIGIWVILALASVCTMLLSMIKIRSIAGALLIMAFLVTFPTLSYGYGYMRDAMFYAFALMFATLAVFLTEKWKYGWLGGAFALMVSLGLYQAWISFAAALVILLIIFRIKDGSTDRKQLVLFVFQNLGMGVVGVGLYLISVKVYNSIFDITLYSAKGIDSMGKIPLSDLPERIINCYHSFGLCLSGKFYYMPKAVIGLNCVILILCLIYSIYIFISKIYLKMYLEGVLFLIATMVLPIGMCLMNIAGDYNDTLSLYAVCLLYIAAIKYFDDFQQHYKKLFTKGVYIISVILIAFFFLITQTYYFKVHVFYQRTYAIANRIIMRIEELDEYPQIHKVVIGGNLRGRKDYAKAEKMFDDVIINDRGFFGQYIALNTSSSDYSLRKFPSFMNGFLGSNFESIQMEEASQCFKTNEYAQMPVWPHKGSVKAIDDIIVVKMEEYYWIDTEEADGTCEFSLQGKHAIDGDVSFIWRIYKNDMEVSAFKGSYDVCKFALDEPGTYAARLQIRDKKTGELLHEALSNDITIE